MVFDPSIQLKYLRAPFKDDVWYYKLMKIYSQNLSWSGRNWWWKLRLQVAASFKTLRNFPKFLAFPSAWLYNQFVNNPGNHSWCLRVAFKEHISYSIMVENLIQKAFANWEKLNAKVEVSYWWSMAKQTRISLSADQFG